MTDLMNSMAFCCSVNHLSEHDDVRHVPVQVHVVHVSLHVDSLQSIAELEAEMLNGQKLQGPQASSEVYKLLQKENMVDK